MAYRALVVGSFGVVPAAAIRGWIDAGHDIAAFWHPSSPTSGPVRRDRRLSRLMPRWSISALGRKHRFPIREVPRLASWPQAASEARATGADVLISVYFRYLIPGDVLDVFANRVVNLHPAPLPRYRGPHPIFAMVLDRSILTDGAMTLHGLNTRFDEGPIIANEPVAFPTDLNLRRYDLGLAKAAAHLTADALPAFLAGGLRSVPQDEDQATYERVSADMLALGPEQTVDEIRWRCATLAKVTPVKLACVEGLVATGFLGIVGPPRGNPPTIGRFSIEFDAADARVRVRRKLPLTSPYRRLHRLAVLASAPEF